MTIKSSRRGIPNNEAGLVEIDDRDDTNYQAARVVVLPVLNVDDGKISRAAKGFLR